MSFFKSTWEDPVFPDLLEEEERPDFSNLQEEDFFDLSGGDLFDFAEGNTLYLQENRNIKGDELSVANSDHRYVGFGVDSMESKKPVSLQVEPEPEEAAAEGWLLTYICMADFRQSLEADGAITGIPERTQDQIQQGHNDVSQPDSGNTFTSARDSQDSWVFNKTLSKMILQLANNFNQERPSLVNPSTATIMPPSGIRRYSISATESSSLGAIDNLMRPPPTPSHRKRERCGIDRIIDEHNKKLAEKAAVKKAHLTQWGYRGIQKKLIGRKAHKYSRSLEESTANAHSRSGFRNHGIPDISRNPLAHQVSFNNLTQIRELQEGDSFQQMGQMQLNPPNWDSFQRMGQMQLNPQNFEPFQQMAKKEQNHAIGNSLQQMGHDEVHPCPQNYNSSAEGGKPEYQPSRLATQFGTSPPKQLEHQNLLMGTYPFKRMGEGTMSKPMERRLKFDPRRQAPSHANQLSASQNRTRQSLQLGNSQQQKHSFQQMGHLNDNLSLSPFNCTSVLDEPHTPLFPERTIWMSQARNTLREQSQNQRQTSNFPRQHLDIQQQQMNVSISAQTVTKHYTIANPVQMQDGRTSAASLAPFSPTYSGLGLGQFNFTLRPKKRDKQSDQFIKHE